LLKIWILVKKAVHRPPLLRLKIAQNLKKSLKKIREIASRGQSMTDTEKSSKYKILLGSKWATLGFYTFLIF
jgi:hypothetical protein